MVGGDAVEIAHQANRSALGLRQYKIVIRRERRSLGGIHHLYVRV